MRTSMYDTMRLCLTQFQQSVVFYRKLSEKSSHEYPIDSTGIKKKLRSVLSYTDICSQDFKKYRVSMKLLSKILTLH